MRRGISSGAVAALALVLVSGCGGTHQQSAPTGALADQLDQRVAAATSRHETPMVCTAWTFGRDPATAADVTQVRTAYAWVYCHDLTDDSGEVVPTAVTLTDPATVRIPGDADLAGDVRRIFPADVQDAAADEPQQAQDLTR